MATTINSGYANSPKLTANIADHADVYGGRALVFDGVTDYLEFDQINQESSPNFTLSFWANASVMPSDGYSAMIFGSGGSDYQGIAFTNTGALYVRLRGASGWAIDDATADVDLDNSLNTWNHYAVTVSPTSYQVYKNGELIKSTNSNLTLNTAYGFKRIGKGAQGFYNGKLSDLRFFNGVSATQAQIQELYIKPESMPSALKDYCVLWYPMIEGNPESPQSIVYDHSEKKLGSEIVTNGTFDSNINNWFEYTSGRGTASWSNGRLRIDQTTGTGNYYSRQYVTFSEGKIYKLSVDVFAIQGTETSLKFIFDNYQVHSLTLSKYKSGDTYTAYLTPTTDVTYFLIGGNGLPDIYELDNISIKEVLMGNHATTNFFGDDLQTGTWNNSDLVGFTGASANGFSADNNESGTSNNHNAYGDEISFVAGKTYQLSFTNTINSGTMPSMFVGVTSGTDGSADSIMAYTLISSAGDFSYNFTPTSTVTRRPSFRFVVDGDYDFTISNFSVKEVGISSSGFETAVNEPVVPQVPLMRYNQKMVFKGISGQYVEVDIDSLSLGDFTISFWYNTNNTNGTFIGRSVSSAIRFSSGTNTLRIGSNNYYISASAEIVNGRFLTATREGTSFKLYVDGVLDSTTTVVTDAWTFGGSGARIGQSAWSNFDGTIHECSVFNTALTQTQVQELFNDGVALDATTHSKANDYLLGYWRNDGVSTWTDRSDIQAIGFDGSDDYISVQDDSSLTVSTALSVSTWVNHNSSGAVQAYVTNWDYPNAGRSYRIYYNSGIKIELSSAGASDTKLITASFTPVVGSWYHIAFTFDSGTVKVYINGESQTVTADAGMHTSLYSSNGVTLIGAVGNESTNTHYMNGKIGQTAIYSSVLSEDDILGIYNLGRKNVDLSASYPTNLIGYWFLNPTHSNPDLTGSNKILDRSGNGNHGTQSGGVNFFGANDGNVQGTPDSITIREGLNTNRDGLGFYFTNPSSNVLRLNGIDEHLKLPYTKSFDMGDGSFTVSAWVKTTLGVGDSIKTILWARDNNDSFKGFEFQIDDSADRPRFVLSDGSGGECNGTTNSVESDKWHFVAVIVDKENDLAKIFLSESDGSALKCQTTTDISARGNINATPDWYVGKRNGATTQDFMGIIDELMVYNIALTAFESDGTTVEAGDTVTSGELLKNYKFSKGKHKND